MSQVAEDVASWWGSLKLGRLAGREAFQASLSTVDMGFEKVAVAKHSLHK